MTTNYKAVFLLSLLAFSSPLMANQLESFTVFQPLPGTSANIYFKKNALIVHAHNKRPHAVTHIPFSLVRKHPSRLYRLFDHNRDGIFEVAALKSVDSGKQQFCYAIFSMDVRVGVYKRAPSGTWCIIRAATNGNQLVQN